MHSVMYMRASVRVFVYVCMYVHIQGGVCVLYHSVHVHLNAPTVVYVFVRLVLIYCTYLNAYEPVYASHACTHTCLYVCMYATQ